jgi:integrase
MASLYNRGDVIWMSFQDETGKWRNRSTGYRKSNGGERRQAELLRDRQTHTERLQRPVTRAINWSWVDEWIESKWRAGSTRRIYLSHWRTLQRWLTEFEITSPVNLTREHCLGYPQWRLEHGGGRNTAIGELKLLGQIMKEALERHMVTENVARALGFEREEPEETRAWTDEELERVAVALGTPENAFGWMRVTYLLGRYQAARLGSCAVPLKCIDLKAQSITYPNPKGGRGRAYTQPIDSRLLAPLREIIEHRKAQGKVTLCDIPDFTKAEVPPSVQWRRFLDGLGITDVSHHDLRRTWVTEAALAGIPESVACRFSNHSSLTIHRIYQRFTAGDMASMLKRLQA